MLPDRYANVGRTERRREGLTTCAFDEGRANHSATACKSRACTVAFEISTALWFIPRIQKRRHANQAAFALAMHPRDEDAEKAAEKLGVEGFRAV